MTTIGAFLKEKALNMAHWIDSEIGKENLSIDIINEVEGMNVFQIILFAAEMEKCHIHRDWKVLMQIAASQPSLSVWINVLQQIRERESMHDKFWRYVELFYDVINSNTDL